MSNVFGYEQLQKGFENRASITEKSMHTLEGILKGVACDKEINLKEFVELKVWFEHHKQLVDQHPFSELIPMMEGCFSDGILTLDESKDIMWLCQTFTTNNERFNAVTADMQRLHGLMHGILADGKISTSEASHLQEWLLENDHLSSIYPYDELASILHTVLADNFISPEEESELKIFFSHFVDPSKTRNDDILALKNLKCSFSTGAICALAPVFDIKGKTFCLTGKSNRATRRELTDIIKLLNGTPHPRVTNDVDYLIVGGEGSDCWAFSCYGRKVEAAQNLRKQGHNIMIIHEADFWDHDDVQAFIYKIRHS